MMKEEKTNKKKTEKKKKKQINLWHLPTCYMMMMFDGIVPSQS